MGKQEKPQTQNNKLLLSGKGKEVSWKLELDFKNNASPGQLSDHPKIDKLDCIGKSGICHLYGVEYFLSQ